MRGRRRDVLQAGLYSCYQMKERTKKGRSSSRILLLLSNEGEGKEGMFFQQDITLATHEEGMSFIRGVTMSDDYKPALERQKGKKSSKTSKLPRKHEQW